MVTQEGYALVGGCFCLVESCGLWRAYELMDALAHVQTAMLRKETHEFYINTGNDTYDVCHVHVYSHVHTVSNFMDSRR